MDGGRYIPMSMWPKCLKTWSPLTQFWRPRLSQERHGTRNVAKPLREDDGGLPAFTEYSSVRFSALCGGLTLLSMNPYSAWAFWWLKIVAYRWSDFLSQDFRIQMVWTSKWKWKPSVGKCRASNSFFTTCTGQPRSVRPRRLVVSWILQVLQFFSTQKISKTMVSHHVPSP